MRKYTFTEKGFTFERINKKFARIAYMNGLTIVVCPCNLRPGYPWYPEISISKKHGGETFENVINAFECHNCINSETGHYSAFYIPVKMIDRFTGETPTAETLETETMQAYDYRFLEV